MINNGDDDYNDMAYVNPSISSLRDIRKSLPSSAKYGNFRRAVHVHFIK